MATATEPTAIPSPQTTKPDYDGDVIRRGIKRTLPCKITDAEFMQIAKQRVDKEALLDQLESDFSTLKSKHKAQVDELQGEIDKARRELHTGEQDRTVLCVEVFALDAKGAAWVQTIRTDTHKPVEHRPATPVESQRYLPVEGSVPGSLPPGAPLLDQAAAAQGKAPADVGDDPDEDSEDDDTPDDDGLQELTPAQKAAKEAAEARRARRNGKGKAK